MIQIVKMEQIRKVYANGFLANDLINFSLNEGEIHAIAGENGAGKSTLMKMLYGFERPTSGDIFIMDKKVQFKSPADALKEGIGMVHQHFMLVEQLTVIENLFLGDELNKYGWLNKQTMLSQAQELIKKYEFNLPLNQKCHELSVSQKQKVEILKVLLRCAKILIFDEPTAVLTAPESTELFKQLKLLKDDGHTIVLITHKLNEIKQLANRVTILRQGKNLGTYLVKDISIEEISRLMVGFDVNLSGTKGRKTEQAPLLKIKDLNLINPNGQIVLKNVSLQVNPGEIFCLIGVEGNGQEEVINCLVGQTRKYQGSITFGETNLARQSIKQLRNMKISYIPADRMTVGANIKASIFDNLMTIDLNNLPKRNVGFYNRFKLIKKSKEQINKYKIVTDTVHRQVSLLSGGNIQKVVAARELEEQPKLLIACYPTRGVDVGTVEFIYEQIRQLRDQGTAILLLSSDWSEILALVDRAAVFYSGEIVANFNDLSKINEHEMGLYMLGVKKDEVSEKQ